MSEISEDAKIIAASNLTLAFFIREHSLVVLGRQPNLHDDSEDAVKGFFEKFKAAVAK